MKPRAQAMTGKTHRIETGAGTLHVTINDDESGMFEVFLRIGKSGGFTSAYTEALGRTISTALRYNVPPETLAKQMLGIRSPRHAMHKGKFIWSVPHAVGIAMCQHIGVNPEDLKGAEDDPADHDSREALQ